MTARVLGLGVICLSVVAAALALALLTLDLRRELAPRLERMATAVLDRQVSVRGPVRLGLWLGGPSLIMEDVRLANAAWGTKPDMLKVGRVEVRARLFPLFKHQIAVHELVLDKVDALVETQKNGDTNRPRPGALGGKVALFGHVKLKGPESLSARHVSFAYRTQQGLPHLAVDFDRIDVRPVGKDSLTLALRGTLGGKTFNIAGTFADAQALIRGRQSPLQGAIALGNSIVHVNGRVGSPTRGPGIALRLEGSAPDLRDFGALIGITGLREGFPLVFSAALTGAHGHVSLSEFSAHVGKGSIVGSLDLSERNGEPSIDGVFASEVLDLEPFLGHWWHASDFAAFAAKPFALDLFRHAHIDVSYQAQLLKLGKAALEAADVRLLLAGGVLTLYPFSIYNDGESLEAEFSIDFNSGGEGEFRAITRRFPLGPLLAGAGHGDALTGDLALSVELTGVGSSPEAMLADLQGQVSLAVTNGALGAAALDYLPQAWRPIYRALGEGEPSVPLACARGRAMFDDGLAEARALLVNTGATTTTGAARLDLSTSELSALLVPRAKSKASSQEQADLALEGPLVEPQALVLNKAQGDRDGALPASLKTLAAAKLQTSPDEPCMATFEGGIVPRVNDPTVITDPTKEAAQAGRAAEGSEP